MGLPAIERYLQQHERGPIVEPGYIQTMRYFADILTIPHPSGHEQLLREYLTKYAEKHNWEYKRDLKGNLLITIPPTPGFENTPGIILQAHMDMVPEMDMVPGKDEKWFINPTGDKSPIPIVPIIDEKQEWLSAWKTTLGADNAKGLATAMAMAEDKSLQHGRLGILCTVEEEIGLKGALDFGFIEDLSKYQVLLNLDSEKEGIATIGCAGGGYDTISQPITKEKRSDVSYLKLSISGAEGGHSAGVIGNHGANAIKVLSETIGTCIGSNIDLNLVTIAGGSKTNAIPRNAEAIIAVEKSQLEHTKQLISSIQSNIKTRFPDDQNLSTAAIDISPEDSKNIEVMSKDSTNAVVGLLNEIKHGVLNWIPGEEDKTVETSTNLALVATTSSGNEVTINIMSRSADDNKLASYRDEIAQTAHTVSTDAIVTKGDTYPGWYPDKDAWINHIVDEVHHEYYAKPIEFHVTHGGLECGPWKSYNPKLQIISIGPTIENAHKTTERLNLPSAERTYLFTKGIIRKITGSKIPS